MSYSYFAHIGIHKLLILSGSFSMNLAIIKSHRVEMFYQKFNNSYLQAWDLLIYIK